MFPFSENFLSPGPVDHGADSGGFRLSAQQMGDRQILQGDAGHVEDGDVVCLALEIHLAGQEVAQRRAGDIPGPLAFADRACLDEIVGKEPDMLEQTGGKFTLAFGVRADTVEMSARLDSVAAE